MPFADPAGLAGDPGKPETLVVGETRGLLELCGGCSSFGPEPQPLHTQHAQHSASHVARRAAARLRCHPSSAVHARALPCSSTVAHSPLAPRPVQGRWLWGLAMAAKRSKPLCRGASLSALLGCCNRGMHVERSREAWCELRGIAALAVVVALGCTSLESDGSDDMDAATRADGGTQRDAASSGSGGGGRGGSGGRAGNAGTSPDDCDSGSAVPGCPCAASASPQTCAGPDRGICRPGSSRCQAGVWGPCAGAVPPAARDCRSHDDNDCDGLPDDTLDDSCACVAGASEACDAHPGRDGVGICTAGTRTCAVAADFGSASFGACMGSVGPAARDCASSADNDCDGSPDDTIDATCACAAGGSQDCGVEPGSGGCKTGMQACELAADGSASAWGACQYAAVADRVACDDGDSARVNDTCWSGACKGQLAQLTLATGSGFSCAVRSGGKVFCWGENSLGRLGNGTTTNSATPVQVSGLDDAVAVTAGSYHACAVRVGGGVRCWGDNLEAQLGDGTKTGRTTPVDVVGLSNAVTVIGGFYATCAQRATGQLMCWGGGPSGMFGSAASTQLTPIEIPAGNGARAVDMGAFNMCALSTGGGVTCWGDNAEGQLGNGMNVDSSTPVAVSGVSTARSISVENLACAALDNGQAVCWGEGDYGVLGNGGSADSSTPVTVSSISAVSDVSVSGLQACALRGGGRVSCWGNNESGTLGDGTMTSSPTPVTVTGLIDALALGQRSPLSSHVCALRATGAVVCWGGNGSGQLGDGTTANRSSPVTVTGLP